MDSIIRKFEERFKFRVLTPEYAILLNLFDRVQEASEQLLEVCGYSRAHFHGALQSLEKRGLVEREVHATDSRVKLNRLTAYCRDELSDMYAATPGWISGQLAGDSEKGVMPRFTRELKRRLGVNHTSCAYEILLFLYDTPDQAVYELFSHSNFSSTTFYAALSRLKKEGLVITRPDANDTRSVRCSLETSTAKFMEEQHVLLLEWLRANLKE